MVSGNFCELLFLIRGFRYLCKIYNDSGILATLKKRLPLLLEFSQPLGHHFPHASCKLMYQVIVFAVISWTILNQHFSPFLKKRCWRTCACARVFVSVGAPVLSWLREIDAQSKEGCEHFDVWGSLPRPIKLKAGSTDAK